MSSDLYYRVRHHDKATHEVVHSWTTPAWQERDYGPLRAYLEGSAAALNIPRGEMEGLYEAALKEPSVADFTWGPWTLQIDHILV